MSQNPGVAAMGKMTRGPLSAVKSDAVRELAAAGAAAAKFDGTGRARPIRPRTLGPVSDLERHLPSEWWRTLFNSLYLETDGDIVENDRNTEQEVDLLVRSAGPQRNDRLLDRCCGRGRHS